ncbi:MAG: HAMP domain-containing sensor histidine kinase [Acidobacteriota bacterium]
MEDTRFTQFRTFLKRHALLAGGFAVMIPLVIIVFLQYRTLSTLNQTLPAYRRTVLRQYLTAVVEEVNRIYSEGAEQLLSVPVSAIQFDRGGVILDSPDCSRATAAVAGVAEHFKRHKFKGARRLFLVVATQHEGQDAGEIFLYDSERQELVRDPKAPEMTAINVAAASYLIYIRRGVRISAMPNTVDRDPRNRLLVKPIVADWDKEANAGKIMALAGMVLDMEFFEKEALPSAIANARPYLGEDADQDAFILWRSRSVLFCAYDTAGKLLASPYNSNNEYQGEVEAYLPLTFAFSNSNLGLRLKHATVEQWARRNFVINLSLWVAMTIFLVASLTLMVRTAAREMKLSQMKADFVSNVSHELRTPLASIRVLAELLNLGRVKDSERVREYGGYIESEGRRLTQVINNILDFSRIESGRKIFHFEQADASEVVQETLEAFSVHLKQNGFTASYEPPAQPLPRLTLDPDAIALALNNLLDNAIKYSGEQKEISVRVEQANEGVTISVADHGIGIAPEEREKIFDKFYRVSTGLVHDVKGSGLGLSLVKYIVEAHRGKITVQSTLGAGSTFTMFFPLNNISDQSGKADAEPTATVKPDAPPFGAESKA